MSEFSSSNPAFRNGFRFAPKKFGNQYSSQDVTKSKSCQIISQFPSSKPREIIYLKECLIIKSRTKVGMTNISVLI